MQLKLINYTVTIRLYNNKNNYLVCLFVKLKWQIVLNKVFG